jgi:hypothetical protein
MLWFIVRVCYAGLRWLRGIVADAFSRPGDDTDRDVDLRPGPLWRDDDQYRGD